MNACSIVLNSPEKLYLLPEFGETVLGHPDIGELKLLIVGIHVQVGMIVDGVFVHLNHRRSYRGIVPVVKNLIDRTYEEIDIMDVESF